MDKILEETRIAKKAKAAESSDPLAYLHSLSCDLFETTSGWYTSRLALPSKYESEMFSGYRPARKRGNSDQLGRWIHGGNPKDIKSTQLKAALKASPVQKVDDSAWVFSICPKDHTINEMVDYIQKTTTADKLLTLIEAGTILEVDEFEGIAMNCKPLERDKKVELEPETRAFASEIIAAASYMTLGGPTEFSGWKERAIEEFVPVVAVELVRILNTRFRRSSPGKSVPQQSEQPLFQKKFLVEEFEMSSTVHSGMLVSQSHEGIDMVYDRSQERLQSADPAVRYEAWELIYALSHHRSFAEIEIKELYKVAAKENNNQITSAAKYTLSAINEESAD